MPSTQDRQRDSRDSDQDIKDDQELEIEAAREERDDRLGIGNHDGDAPNSQSPVGGNLPGEVNPLAHTRE